MLLMDMNMILLRRDLDQRLCIVVAYYNVVAYYYDGDGNAFDGYEDDDWLTSKERPGPETVYRGCFVLDLLQDRCHFARFKHWLSHKIFVLYLLLSFLLHLLQDRSHFARWKMSCKLNQIWSKFCIWLTFCECANLLGDDRSNDTNDCPQGWAWCQIFYKEENLQTKFVLRDGLEYCWCSSRDLCNSNPATVDRANHLINVFIAVVFVKLMQ